MMNTLLATGGIAAVAATFWSHLRTAFTYVSSFVIVQAHFYDHMQSIAIQHLKLEWRVLPSGLLNYRSEYFNRVVGRPRGAVVPFRVGGTTAIFVRGYQVIIATRSSAMVTTLRSLRGMVDFDSFSNAALDRFDLSCAIEREGDTRFSIYRVMGEEKTAGAALTNGMRGDKLRGHSVESVPAGQASCADIDHTCDSSFRFKREDYLASSKRIDPLATLHFDRSVMQHIDQAKLWIGMGDFYQSRGIPWRLGWLFTGPGGTGKSSAARATAELLGIPIYAFELATLSDREFIEEWDGMTAPCIALFEDFDTVFNKREPLTPHKSLTFNCVLNQISGVASKAGVLLIITTNHIDAIDPAMGVASDHGSVSTRPGRIDAVITFGAMSTANRQRMAATTMRDWPDEIDRLVAAGADTTPAQFQEMCIQRAFELLAKNRLRVVANDQPAITHGEAA